MTPLTPERIAELRALLAKATPGPWRERDGGGHKPPSIVGSDCVQVAGWEDRIGGISNASYSEEVCEFRAQMDLPAPAATRALIVALRNAAPALLDAAERAAKWRAVAEELARALRDNRVGHYCCEDAWYSCPKSTDGCADDNAGDECNCGADEREAVAAPALARFDALVKEEGHDGL